MFKEDKKEENQCHSPDKKLELFPGAMRRV